MAEGRWSGRSRHRADNRRRAPGESLAVGWGARDAATRGATVVAAFSREHLADGLARLHGSGFGPTARVLDGSRGNLAKQLERAGLPTALAAGPGDEGLPTSTSLVVVHAPARSAQVADLLSRAGALAVEIVPPVSAPNSIADPFVDLATDAPLAEAPG